MRVGVPKEIKVHEYRVGLTPASVAELTAAGHEVIVETQAGCGIDFDDADYVDAGARIATASRPEPSRNWSLAPMRRAPRAAAHRGSRLAAMPDRSST